MAAFVASTPSLLGGHLPNTFVEPQFPTGSIIMDHVLGFEGGIHHHGRIIHLQGPEHTGKTTLGLHIAGAFQKHYGEPASVFDYERTFRHKYAWACGMDPRSDMTFVFQPENVRKSVRDIYRLLSEDLCRCFVFDSISCMQPDVNMKDFLAGKREVDDRQVGEHARFMKDFFNLIVGIAARKDAILIFVNQLSTKIATTKKDQRAAQWSGTVTNLDYDVKGGRAPKQFASYQIEATKGKAIEGAGATESANDHFLYENVRAVEGLFDTRHNILRNHLRVLKNKVTAGGYREADIYLRPGGGIDDWISVRELALHYGLIKFLGASKGYRIGTDDDVIAVYANKQDAINALVIQQDLDVLTPLRAMVTEMLKGDDESFRFKPSAQDLLMAGEEDSEDFLNASTVVTEDALLDDIAGVDED